MDRSFLRALALAVLAVALLAPFAADPKPALACSCVAAPVADDLSFTDTVFAGRVLHVGKGWKDGYSGPPREVTVAVDHVWRGSVPGRATVVTASGGASCGYESFVVGQRFVVYAQARSGAFETNLCSPTRPYDDASVKLLERVTGPGVVVEPIAATDEIEQEDGFDSRTELVAAFTLLAGIVAVAGIATLWWQRNR